MRNLHHLKYLHTLQRIVPILIGSGIYAFSLHYFVIPNELMEGGVTGLSLLLFYVTGVPPSITTLLINFPLFLMGWKSLGRPAMVYSIIGTMGLSVSLWMMETWITVGSLHPFQSEEDMLLAALYAGVTIGGGLGIVFRFGGTTGGADIIAKLVHKWRGWRIGKTLLVIDAIVITSSLLYISLEKVLYTLVVAFIASNVIDFIQDGAYAAKAFMIISERPEEICTSIETQLQRGVTLLQAKGGHTYKDRKVVYCVVNKQEARKLKLMIKTIDPHSFVVINDVHDVLGEGFHPQKP